MEQEGVAPDPATYNLQLAMHQKRARHEACAELFRTVSSRGATLTVQGYNAVLKSLSELNAPAAQVPLLPPFFFYFRKVRYFYYYYFSF